MNRSSALVFTALLAVACLLAIPRVAEAYPQWQFRDGTVARCNQCHFSPAGGGLVTGYGRDASGEELSTFAGEGAFLHGAVDLPGWLALGFDGRYSVLTHDPGGPQRPTNAYFPMQADFHARAALPRDLSVSATVGLRGQMRADGGELGPDNYVAATASRLVSREHYLMWRPQNVGPYLRAGRFFVPYGLRLAEHASYVRRDLGFNLLEESYNVSGGLVMEDWELHLTAFGPDFARDLGAEDWGGAALYEHRLGSLVAAGAQSRVRTRDDVTWLDGGLFGKLYLPFARTMLMTELNLSHGMFPGEVADNRFVGLVGASVFPIRGVWLSAYLERSQRRLSVSDSAVDGYSAQINWFPYPHFEILLLGRMQTAAGGAGDRTGLCLLHYYL